MPSILGIHNGHHSACAVVRDGILASAVEQERFTRIKGSGADGLTNDLPVAQALRAADLSLREIDLIVSSFQAMGPGGVGLQRPLITSGFNLFDPWDTRHFVVSHHYAHALSAVGCSGYTRAAAIVCDLAGSTTLTGQDFVLPFGQFIDEMSGLHRHLTTKTECVSIYDICEDKISLKYRDYCVPHNAPEVFVCSAGSLYDNASRAVFGKEDAHGQLMALAAMHVPGLPALSVDDLVAFNAETGDVIFRNDWQKRVTISEEVLTNAGIAASIQVVTEQILLHYTKMARSLSGASNLVAAGGVFLNILANSRIALDGDFGNFFVPSAPHDSGIAVGCAFHGWRQMAKERSMAVSSGRRARGRLGIKYKSREISASISRANHLIENRGAVTPNEVARRIQNGQVVARCSGRAEFGPRALGGRSLLASPLLAESKTRLNRIKERQVWRPVAPVVLKEHLPFVFTGPLDSPYMCMAHFMRTEHRDRLPALYHPDGSSRCQTIEFDDDPFLCSVLKEFGAITGYFMLANTSLNGPGSPILETPDEAIEFFLCNDSIDFLLLEDQLVLRTEFEIPARVQWMHDTILTCVGLFDRSRSILLRGTRSMEISEEALDAIRMLRSGTRKDMVPKVKEELRTALRMGFIEIVES